MSQKKGAKGPADRAAKCLAQRNMKRRITGDDVHGWVEAVRSKQILDFLGPGPIGLSLSDGPGVTGPSAKDGKGPERRL